MKDRDLERILERILVRRQWRGVDRVKLVSLMENATLRAPLTDVNRGLERVKRSARTAQAGNGRSLRWLPWTRGILVATAAVIVASAGVWMLGTGGLIGEDPRPVRVTGEVSVIRDSITKPLAREVRLHDADVVMTGARSFADLILDDGLKIRILENSAIDIGALDRRIFSGTRRRIELRAGTALFQVKKQRAGNEIIIAAGPSTARIRGTLFGVRLSGGEGVRYEVAQGKILLSHRLMLDEKLIKRAQAQGIIERLEKHFEREGVCVGAHQSGEIPLARGRELSRAVLSIIEQGDAENSATNRLMIDTLARELQKPLVSSFRESAPRLLAEFSDFSGEAIGAGRETYLDMRSVSGGSVEKFNYGKWIREVHPSYLFAAEGGRLLVSVDREGRITALSHGTQRWSYAIGSRIISRPAYGQGAIYVATEGRRLIALSLKDGRLLWSRLLEGGIGHDVRVLVSDTSLFAATVSGRLYRYDGRGGLVWQIKLPAAVYSSPVRCGQRIYVPAQDGVIYGIGIESSRIEIRAHLGSVVKSSIAERDDRLYIANYGGEIMCYNCIRDEVEWRFGARERIVADPVLDQNYLYAATANGTVYKLTTAGSLVWRVHLGNMIEKSPVIGNGNLYILSKEVFYLIDRDKGALKWSYVMPSEAASNIALSRGEVYFGVKNGGIISVKQ